MVTIDGNPWFVASDVSAPLGWTLDNLRYHLKSNLTADEKRVVAKRDGSLPTGSLFEGNMAWVTLISESGLYKLVMRSDKPQAKPFQDWVTKVVLAAIRKDGMYVVGEEKAPPPTHLLGRCIGRGQNLPLVRD
ncbi:BRO family protein [Mesorhizobium sp. WSM4311]|nr:BRO family protein [Mesorhizobium sp. WSM4305]PBC22352.1 BRO family protein [Mesorhizobium sp. WSM4311]TRD09650.1 BRO family protein [Mesorhizobium sp. WSM4305]